MNYFTNYLRRFKANMTYPEFQIEGHWHGDYFTNPPIGIIIHSISEYLDGIHAPIWLQSHPDKLGCHACISPEGGRHLCQSTDKKAYHAGRSSYKGIFYGLNSSFLGIELLLKGEHTWSQFQKNIHKPGGYSEAQHYATALQCAKWMAKIPSIDPSNIVLHSEVSGRQFREDYKIDPGQSFNKWLFFKYLNELS